MKISEEILIDESKSKNIDKEFWINCYLDEIDLHNNKKKDYELKERNYFKIEKTISNYQVFFIEESIKLAISKLYYERAKQLECELISQFPKLPYETLQNQIKQILSKNQRPFRASEIIDSRLIYQDSVKMCSIRLPELTADVKLIQ